MKEILPVFKVYEQAIQPFPVVLPRMPIRRLRRVFSLYLYVFSTILQVHPERIFQKRSIPVQRIITMFIVLGIGILPGITEQRKKCVDSRNLPACQVNNSRP